MRTTLDIPDALLKEAMKASKTKVKRTAVIKGLEEIVRRAKMQEFVALAGTMDLNIDLKASRGR